MHALLLTVLWTCGAPPMVDGPQAYGVPRARPVSTLYTAWCGRIWLYPGKLPYLKEYYRQASYDYRRQFDYPMSMTPAVPRVYTSAPHTVISDEVVQPLLSSPPPVGAH